MRTHDFLKRGSRRALENGISRFPWKVSRFSSKLMMFWLMIINDEFLKVVHRLWKSWITHVWKSDKKFVHTRKGKKKRRKSKLSSFVFKKKESHDSWIIKKRAWEHERGKCIDFRAPPKIDRSVNVSRDERFLVLPMTGEDDKLASSLDSPSIDGC